MELKKHFPPPAFSKRNLASVLIYLFQFGVKAYRLDTMADEIKWKTLLEAAEHNDMDAVKYFVEKKHVSMTTCDSDELTAAHIALKNNNLELFKYLVNNYHSNVTATEKNARNVLIQAVDQGSLDAIKYLIEEREEDVEQAHNLYYGNTAVHMAALRDKLDILKYFLEDRQIDVNIRSAFEETPLFLAAERVNMPIVKYLVEKRKARTSLTDKNKNNVIYISARKGDLNVPRYILDEQKHHIDLNSRDFFGETVLHRAVKFQHFPFIEYMVDEKNVNLNLADDIGNTPLHVAAEKNDLKIVEFLCGAGALTHLKNEDNRTAIDMAKEPQVVEVLKRAASDSNRRRRRSVPGSFTSDVASLHRKHYNNRKGLKMAQNPEVVWNERRKRSVFGSFAIDSSFQSHGRGMKIIQRAQSWSSGVGQFGSNPIPADHVISNSLNSVLILIGACQKIPSMESYIRAPSATSSREDILQGRMNSVTIDSIQGELES